MIKENISNLLSKRFRALVKGKANEPEKSKSSVTGGSDVLSKSGIAWSEDSFKYSNRLAN